MEIFEVCPAGAGRISPGFAGQVGDCSLATLNREEFRRVRGLVLVDLSKFGPVG